MKKEKFRYTEYKFTFSNTTTEGWVKLIFLHFLLGPFRLVNEISQKLIFLGERAIKRVLVTSIGINCVLIIWNMIIWPRLAGGSGSSFIPSFSMVVSLLGLGGVYMFVGNIPDFSYDVLSEEELQEDLEKTIAYDTDSIRSFDSSEPAEIMFNESINIFISSPEELEVHGIPATVYQAAEDDRLVSAIATSGKFPVSPISSKFFKLPLDDQQVNENLSRIYEEVEEQLKSRNVFKEEIVGSVGA